MKRVTVIGSGPAGVAAAQAAAQAGASATLIGAQATGGRTTWSSLLPSKVLLSAADIRGAVQRAPALGLSAAADARPSVEALVQRIQAISHRESEARQDELRDLGVEHVRGTVTFEGSLRLRIAPPEGSSRLFETDAVVIATGSVPIFPPALKPDGKLIIAPRFVSQLQTLPSSMLVVGGGVTGTEFAYAFRRLGVAVTWLVDEFGVLPPFERKTVRVLVDALERQGVALHQGTAVESAAADGSGVTVTMRDGRAFRAGMAFVAVGRRPDIAALNLEAAGVASDVRTGVTVDEYMRTAAAGVYAAGDAAGFPMTANKAKAQGWIAGRHAAGARVAPYRIETIVEAVYTDPQIAQIGLTEERAKESGRPVRVLRRSYQSVLKAALVDETEGFVQLVADAKTGALLGASAVGAHASDILTPLALGIRMGATLDDLAAVFPGHPSISEIAFEAGRGLDDRDAS
jgi:pyruvate/2-oxoglutarate dehydrogenase complex dihydrolipoamide dehydrogenase (E3) component